jgi:periplasmic copper chaperone A
MKFKAMMILAGASVCLISAAAEAHFAVSSGPAFANKSQVVDFGVAHGCDGNDTYAVRLEIPAGVTSVRPMNSDFGATTVEKDGMDNVTAVVWQKAPEDALDADTNYYKLSARMKVPDKPFSQIYFKVLQTCRAADGTLSTVEWKALPGEMGEPAAALTVLPARLPGWNKYTVPDHLTDLTIFFQDALIVWRENGAWSFNPATADLIKGTAGVTTISDGLHPDDEIWVRY